MNAFSFYNMFSLRVSQTVSLYRAWNENVAVFNCFIETCVRLVVFSHECLQRNIVHQIKQRRCADTRLMSLNYWDV